MKSSSLEKIYLKSKLRWMHAVKQRTLDILQKCDEERRAILLEIETLRHQRNVVSDQIAEMKKAGDAAETPVAEMRAVSSRIKELDKELNT